MTMQYLLLIYADENGLARLPKDQADKALAEYGKFTSELKESGKLLGSNRLRPVANSTTVRVREGKTQMTDGPFAEAREALGGYYLIEAKDLDEATKIAARCPGAHHGSVEIRPIWAM
jgi:hypothetical protein